MIKIDLNKFKEDEESEFIVQEIAKFRAKNVKNNIDFEKAELEKNELELKLSHTLFDNNHKNLQKNENNFAKNYWTIIFYGKVIFNKFLSTIKLTNKKTRPKSSLVFL